MSTQSGYTALLTPEEADMLPDATAFELDDGVLEERNLATDSVTIAFKLAVRFDAYAERVGGFAYGDGLGLRLWPGRRRFVRPDACYFAPGALAPDVPGRKDLVTTPPTVVVEVISPGDAAANVTQKTLDYLGAGVSAAWEIYPDSRVIYIHRANQPTQVIPGTATLKDLPELPGFECDVASLFPPVQTE